MGETRVDLQHLLEDLRDAYTGALEETILTEVVANALDSGATRIRLLTDPAAATLTIVDDGRGMQRRELVRDHDVASKVPGSREVSARLQSVLSVLYLMFNEGYNWSTFVG